MAKRTHGFGLVALLVALVMMAAFYYLMVNRQMNSKTRQEPERAALLGSGAGASRPDIILNSAKNTLKEASEKRADNSWE